MAGKCLKTLCCWQLYRDLETPYLNLFKSSIKLVGLGLIVQVWASLLLYRQILDEIEANDYNNFTKRAYVNKAKKIVALPIAYARSLIPPTKKPPLTIKI